MEVVKNTNKGIVSTTVEIEDRIMIIRNEQVMIDRDLAEVYQVEVKVLNQAVRRNIERFPERFRFQLTDGETNKLVTDCDRFGSLKHSSVNPHAYTEQGVAMLSTVLHSETAIQVSILIMDAFVEMRRTIGIYGSLLQRMDNMERKQIEDRIESDRKFERVFRALEAHEVTPKEGVFFDGQVFDAYVFASNILR
jgi:hypothetical protein